MNETPHAAMLEATRFVQAGRLREATALLQRLLQGEPGPATTAGDTADAPVGRAPRIIDVAPETGEVTDHPPAPRSEQEAFGTRAGRWPTGGPEGTAQSPLPEALRNFLERLNRTGSELGLEGLARPFPAQAPEVVPNGATFVAGSYSNQAGSRAYKLYIPSGYRPGQALPLVVMLHGCTQSPDDFAAGTRMNALAEEHLCLVAYPAQAAAANTSKCWNWFSPGDQQREQGEPSLIAGITRQVMRDYPVDPQRVYVAGLSAGGAAAAIMGATYPELYAAVGVHSGLAYGAARDLPSAFAAMQQGGAAAEPRSGGVPDGAPRRIVPTIVFHGDRDSTVNPRNGDQVIAQARAATTTGLQATATVQHGQVPGGRTYRRTLHADARGQAILEQWVIHGADHAWSGGSPAGSYTDPQGPDAAREMLRFFLEHPLPTAVRQAH
jgi:poly(hydroxyalkanoate) depolymerase family esterase